MRGGDTDQHTEYAAMMLITPRRRHADAPLARRLPRDEYHTRRFFTLIDAARRFHDAAYLITMPLPRCHADYLPLCYVGIAVIILRLMPHAPALRLISRILRHFDLIFRLMPLFFHATMVSRFIRR